MNSQAAQPEIGMRSGICLFERQPLFFFFFQFICFYLFYFWLCWGLCCCARAFSSCVEQGLLFVAVHRLLIAVASHAAEHGLQVCRLQQMWCVVSVVMVYGLSSCGSWALEHKLSSCGAQAQLLHGMWDLPRPGLEPVSPALAGEFLTTVPPGKPSPYS